MALERVGMKEQMIEIESPSHIVWFCTLDRREFVSIGDASGVRISGYGSYYLRHIRRLSRGSYQLVAEIIEREGFRVLPQTLTALGFGY